MAKCILKDLDKAADIPAYANSTYDNPYFDKETAYKYYNEFMWPKRYAKTVSVEEAIEMMKGE